MKRKPALSVTLGSLATEPAHVQLQRKILEVRQSRKDAEMSEAWSAVTAMHRLEMDLIMLLSPALPAMEDATRELSDADLVAQIAADVAALPPAVRARVQASTNGPSLRLVGTRKTTA